MSKSGLANVFGTDTGYVLNFNVVKDKHDIYNAFKDIMNNEENIRAHYSKFLPDYVKTVEDTAKLLLERYLK